MFSVREARSVAFSPSLPGLPVYLAIGLSNSKIQLCDVGSGKVLHTLTSNDAADVCHITFSQDGTLLAGCNENHIQLWNVKKRTILVTLQGLYSSVTSAAFSPDGRMLASSYSDGRVRLWNIQTGRLYKTMENRCVRAYSVNFSADGCLLASALGDGSVRLWNVQKEFSESVLWCSDHLYDAQSATFLGTNSSHLVSTSADNIIRIWNIAESTIIKQFHMRKTDYYLSLLCTTISPDGRQIACSFRDGTVQIRNLETGILLKERCFGETQRVISIAFHPNSKQIALVKRIQIKLSYEHKTDLMTTCAWSDRTHHLFYNQNLRRIVFLLMCVKARQDANYKTLGNVCLPMAMWLHVCQAIASLY